jgi:hypothetical protein
MNAKSWDRGDPAWPNPGAQALWDHVLGRRPSDGEEGESPSKGVAFAPDARDVVVEIHVPLSEGTDTGWISSMQERIDDAVVDGRDVSYDDGEEWTNAAGESEYLFFLHGAPAPALLRVAAIIGAEVGAPQGMYATVNDGECPMGEGAPLGPVTQD